MVLPPCFYKNQKHDWRNWMKNKRRNIYKISAERFRASGWDLYLEHSRAVELNEVVALFDSQMFRLIEQIRGREIKSTEEVLAVTFRRKSDFTRATRKKGIKLNGITFKRFVGTTGGLKNYTVLFVNAEIIDELNRRCECGRNQDIKLVPAKYEAYKALTASASIEIPNPKSLLVVSDSITHHCSNVIKLDGSKGELPVIEHIDNYLMENNATDGFNLCTIEYMQRIAESLRLDYTPSGVCLRNAWTKGMLVPFPIQEFAEQQDNYIVQDIWGNNVDIRNVEMILTESSLKLWKCYDSVDDYLQKTTENGYNFAVTKVTPKILENDRALNYQYLQSYELTNEDIQKLCLPTIQWLEDSMCGTFEATLKFLGVEDIEDCYEDDWKKGLFLDENLLQDDFVRGKIKKLIQKKVANAKIGKLKCQGNYQIVTGDPYILMQHIYGLKETGLLKAREIYSQYWKDKDVDEVVIFRSPMTSHENIRKVKIKNSDECSYWYRYIDTMSIINSFDDICCSLNGMDYDGDTIYSTNNDILLSKYKDLPSILCIQETAEKKIITEEEIIKSNWLGMGISVGAITNRVTAMYDKIVMFDKDSDEYKEIYDRIIHGQNFQQNSINC